MGGGDDGGVGGSDGGGEGGVGGDVGGAGGGDGGDKRRNATTSARFSVRPLPGKKTVR